MIPCYIFTAILFVIKLYRDYIACIMCLEFDRLETVIVYVLIKFCSVLFCSVLLILSRNDFKGSVNAIIIFNLESITFSVKQRENTFADP